MDVINELAANWPHYSALLSMPEFESPLTGQQAVKIVSTLFGKQ